MIRREFKEWKVWDERYHTFVHGSFHYLYIDEPTTVHLVATMAAVTAIGTDWLDSGMAQLIVLESGIRLTPSQVIETCAALEP